MIHTILVVEDDQDLRDFLKDLLLDLGYTVFAVADGLSAVNFVNKKRPNLVILDLQIPTLSGESVCKEIKKNYPDLPIIILTAKDSLEDVVSGLNIGADDYIKKPFETEELLARVRARLRSVDHDSNVYKIADLEMNNNTFSVKRNNKDIKLTPQEFKMLQYLLHNQGRVLTREIILGRIWSANPDIETRVVDVYVGYLRKKVDKNFKRKLIHSVRGFGYMIK